MSIFDVLLPWWWRKRRRPSGVSSWEPTPQTALITDDGRRHLVAVPYLLPKDGLEMDRLNFQHYFFKSILGGLYVAPLETTITHILDVGCGTGIWMREMAKAFPQAHVMGLDLEPPEHTNQAFEGGNVSMLVNCKFVKGNVLSGLPFADETFDFVHQRLLIAAIPAARWQAVVNDLVRVTRRGGWVELFEVSASYPKAGPAQQQFLRWGDAAAKKAAGIDFACAFRLREFLHLAGLQHVKMRVLRVPLGKWGGHAGGLLAQDTLTAYKTLQPAFVRQLGITPAQFEAVMQALPGEWETYRTEFDIPFAYGQRL